MTVCENFLHYEATGAITSGRIRKSKTYSNFVMTSYYISVLYQETLIKRRTYDKKIDFCNVLGMRYDIMPGIILIKRNNFVNIEYNAYVYLFYLFFNSVCR